MSCWLLAWVLLGPAPGPAGEFLVVTSVRTPLQALTRRQLRQIWLKKLDRIDGVRVAPLQLREEADPRPAFESWLFQDGFNSREYWLEQGLTGGEKPPTEVNNQAVLMLYLSRNPGFIGYIGVQHEKEMKKLGLKVLKLSD